MRTLGERLDAAIKASGKTAEEIARNLNVRRDRVSRIRTGAEENPKVQVLIGLARETNTTVGALLGDPVGLSANDEEELLQFRGWIDVKLATIDASREPNAVLVTTPAPASQVRESRVADRSRQSERTTTPFDADAQLVLTAIGDSMNGAGILANDTLYAVPAPSAAASAVGKLIACRLGDAVFVKRLVSEHGRLYLLSANPRYRAIQVDASSFEILGVVVGRVGRV